MAFLKLDNPWNPAYAIPTTVEAEPRGRGTLTTGYIPRGTIGTLPADLKTGYAMPTYVEAEPLGRGTYTSEYIPRRTIEQFIPASFSGLGAEPAAKSIPKPGFKGDPILAYGQRVAHYLVSTITTVPEELRKVTLKALLDEIDPGIWNSAAIKAADWKAKGAGPKAALQKALAGAIAERMGKDILEAGKTGQVKPGSLLGLGYYDALGWGLPSLSTIGKTIGKGVATVGKGAAALTGKALEYAKKALDKIASLSCAVLNNKYAGMTAKAIAISQGAPPDLALNTDVLAIHKKILGCGGKGGTVASQGELMNPYPGEQAVVGAPAGAKKPFPIVPVAIAGGAALLLLALV